VLASVGNSHRTNENHQTSRCLLHVSRADHSTLQQQTGKFKATA